MTQQIMSLKPFLKESLHRKIADAIIDYINTSGLKAGEKLPSERALSESLSISRNSLREALRVLENEGIIEVRTGKGTYVTGGPSENIINVKLWKVDYKELLEIKYLLERGFIEQLCYYEKTPDLSKVEQALCQMEEAAKLGLYLQRADYVFHNELRQMITNTAMVQLIDTLVKTLDSYGDVLRGAEQIWISTIPYHRQILEGIQEKDFVKAGEACRIIYETDLHALQLKEEYDL